MGDVAQEWSSCFIFWASFVARLNAMLFRFMERLDQPQLTVNPDHRWLYDSVDIQVFSAVPVMRALEVYRRPGSCV